MTTYTTSLRFVQPTIGGGAGTWASQLNSDFALIEASITGDNGYAGGSGGISIAALTAYTLTANSGAADQARQLLYPFVGALSAGCTVTIPASVKIGWVLNATTGGFNVILTTGSGTTLTVLPGGWVFFYCDGTNVTSPAFTYSSLKAATFTATTSMAAPTFAATTNMTAPVFTAATSMGSPTFAASVDMTAPVFTAATSGVMPALTANTVSQINSTNGLKLAGASDKLAFFGGTPAVKATVPGAKGGNAALTSLMTALVGLGLVTDTTT